jgi:hypothetical protein
MLVNFINVPLGERKSIPIGTLGQRRGTVKSIDVIDFAVQRFNISKRGITVADLQIKFGITKLHARQIVKRYCKIGTLFAPENHKPKDTLLLLKDPRL